MFSQNDLKLIVVGAYTLGMKIANDMMIRKRGSKRLDRKETTPPRGMLTCQTLQGILLCLQ